MEQKILEKNKVNDLIKHLQQKFLVIAPQKQDKGVVFAPLEKAEDLTLDFTNSKLSPKSVFFPQSERLLKYTRGEKQELEAKETLGELKDQVVFGIRSCDQAAIAMLDKVFLTPDEWVDPYYKERRDKTVIIGVTCREPAATCFCTALGIEPWKPSVADVQLYDLDDKYLVEVISERGEKALDGFQDLTSASQGDIDNKDKTAEEVKAKVQTDLNVEGIAEKLKSIFDSDWWESVYLPCLACGTCTYVCPTCHCFDITDDVRKDNGQRARNWDSCMFPLFTHHTSGHNPRPSGKERWRQRLSHKFRYFVENYEDIACVGCGRCIMNCPVGIDIRKIVAEAQQQPGE
jgi:sulfhydrogenase subunit beta (sulfur reductase)